MSDSVTLEGKEYVLSKKAAELSGYAQDYIGQLARGGFIEAKRIGGLWYVSMQSLQSYKTNSESRARTIPPPATDKSAESVISFDGTEYVSAAKAAEITGYNSDYVGQLARANTIPSQQVGNRWYVDRARIVAHKQEKDALLAAVQAQSVGIAKKITTSLSQDENSTTQSVTRLRYVEDKKELIPDVKKDITETKPQSDELRDAEIRRSRTWDVDDDRKRLDLRTKTRPIETRPRPVEVPAEEQRVTTKAKKKVATVKFTFNYLHTILFGVLVALFVGFAGLKLLHRAVTSNVQPASTSAPAARQMSPYENFVASVERVMSPEISFYRSL